MKRLVVVLALAACSKPAPDVMLSVVHAIDGDTAVALFRTRGDRYTIGVIDGRGTVRWRSKVPGEPYSIGPQQGVAVIGEVAVVRYAHMDRYRALDHSLAGYSLRDGKLLWDTTIAKYVPEPGRSRPGLPTWISTAVVVGKLAVFTQTGATGNRFDVIDPATGATTATYATGEYEASYAPTTVGTRLFTHHVNQTTSYDVAGRSPEHLDTAYEGCAVGAEYVTLESRNEVTELVAYRDGERDHRRVIASPFPPTPGWTTVLRRCGSYRDRLVLLVEARGNPRGETTQVIVADAAGTVLSTIDLQHDLLWEGSGSGHKHDASTAPLGGELTRYVPYVQITYSPEESERRERLVMLDLEEGKIAWAGPDDDDIIHMRLFRSGARWLTFFPHSSGLLTTFDGATGEPTASKQLQAYDGVAEVRSYHAAGDRLWIYGGRWTASSTPTIGLLDTTTLEPVFVRGIEVRDALAETKKRLGR